jgi:hypothetical protein
MMKMTTRAAIHLTAVEESHGGDLFGGGCGEKWRLRWYILITINVGGGGFSKRMDNEYNNVQ